MSVATMAGTMQPAFWQRFGNAAQIASAVVAMFALGAIYWQVQFNFKLSREQYRPRNLSGLSADGRAISASCLS